MTLTEFLLARIAEDEAAAHGEDYAPMIDSPVQERFTAARVLAECAAKRRIVEQFGAAQVVLDHRPMSERIRSDASPAHAYWTATREAVKHLALPHADHPDYREEWKP